MEGQISGMPNFVNDNGGKQLKMVFRESLNVERGRV